MPKRRLEEMSRRLPQRICVIKPSALGDVAQTLPILPALKKRFPDAEISWVIQRGLHELLTDHPDLRHVILFDRHGGWRDGWRMLAELSRHQFDMVLDLQGLFRTGVMTAATRAPYRIGLETAREGSRWSLTHVLPETSRDVPAHERYLRVVDALGGDRRDCDLIVSVSPEDQRWADEQRRTFPGPAIAVHPGARWETKRWPVEKYAELLSRAVDEWHAGILILGSPAEREEADRLEQGLSIKAPRASVRNLTGQSSLKQLTALLQRVDAVVSNDSGPMHLAAGLGTPTLGIFTCTDAVRSGPGGSRHETVSTAVSCAGSYCKTCPHSGEAHLACFRELDIERVWQALRRLAERNNLFGRRLRVA